MMTRNTKLIDAVDKRDIMIANLREQLHKATKENAMLKKKIEGRSERKEIHHGSTMGLCKECARALPTNGDEKQEVVGKRKKRATKPDIIRDSPNRLPETNGEIKGETNEVKCEKTFNEIIDDRLEEARFQEQERLRRAPNIIIHGMINASGCNDSDSVKKLLDAINIDHVPKSVIRLGKRKAGPVKVVMKTLKEKIDVMKALPRLKHSNLKVSITDDYTQEERKKIGLYLSKAKTKNMSEPEGQVWCVKGSPRTKLRIVKKDRINQNSHTTTKDATMSASQRPIQA